MHSPDSIRTHVLLASLLIAATPAQADEAVIVGGGSDVHATPAQIELNVNWIDSVINKQGLMSSIWFTDGAESGADVLYLSSEEEAEHELTPLTRVFGNPVIDRHRYRENEIDNVIGSTRLSELAPALTNRLEQTADQSLLFVFSGDGNPAANGAAGVSMKLWDNTSLSANKLHAMLDARKAPFRFVMNQCFSGGFHKLAFKNPAKGLDLASGQRCGFSAESAWHPARSCGDNLRAGDYQDYTTSFFAALSGFDRDGELIAIDPDIDGNGETSLREAHFFTLSQTDSVDLPRSTSEQYLNDWQPWYLRWLPPGPTLPGNEYAKLFRDVSVNLGIELGNSVGKELRKQLLTLHDSLEKITIRQTAAIDQLQSTRTLLQNSALSRWPALKGPYSGAFITMASEGQLGEIAAFLGAHEQYGKMVAEQKRVDSLQGEMLELEHQAAQRQKLFYLRRLAVLKEQLTQHGSAKEQADYLSLLDCEEAPLNNSN